MARFTCTGGLTLVRRRGPPRGGAVVIWRRTRERPSGYMTRSIPRTAGNEEVTSRDRQFNVENFLGREGRRVGAPPSAAHAGSAYHLGQARSTRVKGRWLLRAGSR